MSNDFSIKNSVYGGTIDNRIRIFVNCSPSADLKNNDLYRHFKIWRALAIYKSFYRKSTQFGNFMSRVEQKIYDRTHDD